MPSKKKQPEPEVRHIETYGCPTKGHPQLVYDRWAYALKRGQDDGAPNRNVLFRKIADTLVPGWFEWHTWTNRLVDGLNHNMWVGLSGCSNSAKTRNVAGFACTWWLAYPERSAVIFCSTTSKALRRRGWAEVQNYYQALKYPRFGNFVDSRMLWQSQRGDDKHCIMGIAVEEGSTTKVADNIKGFHTKRLMIAIDEATAVPPAIFEACTNMWSYPKEFILVLMGNPRSRLDEFGKFIEPAKGWNSVSVDIEEWDSTPKLNGANGVVIRFDAERSPNIVEGKLVSKHLPTKEKIHAWKQQLASIGAENDPSYWSNARGFPPPDGLSKTVFSENLLEKYEAKGRHQFTGNGFRIVGALDPARTGGDRAAVRFAAMGEIPDGKWGIEWMPPQVVTIDAKSNNPVDFQITEAVQRMCENVQYRGQRYVCKPEDFGVDATGGGADLCDIMQKTWSPNIQRVIFSGATSEDPCSFEDARPANTVYRNKRVEMYFRSKNALVAGQLKGIDTDTAKELCSIEYDDSKALITLMPKSDYKEKFGRSPDYADSGVIIIEVARRKGFKVSAVGHSVNRSLDFDKLVKQSQAVYENVDYSADNADSVLEYEMV